MVHGWALVLPTWARQRPGSRYADKPRPDRQSYCHLTRMSFLTDFTPLTLRATSTALLMSAWDRTKPLSCTTPLKVSTLISADFREGSLKTSAFTFVVMAVSSIYSPVPSCFDVDAQPTNEARRTVTKKTDKRLSCVMAKLSN